MNICCDVKIDWELDRIRKNIPTVLSECTNVQAWNILQNAKNEWKIFWSGCDNMWLDWKYLGHNPLIKTIG